MGQATNHNLVLVDGAGPAIGAPGAGSPTTSTIQETLQTPLLAYGEVATAYQGATITRKALFVRSSYYLLADVASATAAHAYTWQLHGYGLTNGNADTGTFTDGLSSQEGTWQKNGVSLLAHVATAGDPATYTTVTNQHETTYNTAESHTTLLVQTPSAPLAVFLAGLYPYTTQPPRVATTSQASTAALATTGTGFIDIAFAQADSVLSTDASGQLPQAVSADGLLNFYSATANGSFSQLFVQAGTVLRVGPTPVLRATPRANVSWQNTGGSRYNGYANRRTTLRLSLPRAPTSVVGTSVASYAYDADSHALEVVLAAAGSFEVQLGSSPLPVVLASFAGQRQGPAVQLRWCTASELPSQGTEVQRQAAAGASFMAIGFVPGAGKNTQATAYAFRDTLALATTAYYRLRQFNQDGVATYSPVVAVGPPPGAGSRLLPVFPQPVQRLLHVQVAGPAQLVTLRLCDGLGRLVHEQLCQQQAQLDLSHLRPGLYYLVAHDATGAPIAGGQRVVVAP
ncbi:hypothetical protein BEN49_17405 [Hymenobacter coccineus]|uniref:Secretion system C-terminal sorting domain-containing protein n=1 Tax=Hymenobacter coccineus TaxID=1908235 RepID=A0A1G1TMF5_9BACT|nr:hypothetical protein BEN49_17405 [Hymenobacter coccineus]